MVGGVEMRCVSAVLMVVAFFQKQTPTVIFVTGYDYLVI